MALQLLQLQMYYANPTINTLLTVIKITDEMKTVNNRSCLVAILLEQEKVAAYINFEGEKIGLFSIFYSRNHFCGFP